MLPEHAAATSSTTRTALKAAGWVLIALYAAWSFGLQRALAGVLDPFSRNLVEQALLTAFFLTHALGQWRVRELGAYALVCFVISNLFENLSVLYGFPFGGFHHSEVTGPRLFNIPWLATPTYMAMGYISWSVAQVLVGRTHRAHWRSGVLSAAIIAAFVFSMWDFSNDAVFHTINKAFFYDNPGPWFGVPVSNFAGWLFTTFIIFGAFGAWLAHATKRDDSIHDVPGLRYWQQAIAMYALVGLGGIYRNVNGRAIDITLANGDKWQSADIYAAMSLTTVFTMLFCAVLAAVRAEDISVNNKRAPAR